MADSLVLIIILLFTQMAVAADGKADSTAKNAGETKVDSPQKNQNKKPAEKLDLNQVDLEQLEENWESTPSKAVQDVNNSIKIREIIEPSGEYSYASFGKPDPFLPSANLFSPISKDEAAPLAVPTGKEIEVTSPLQRHPLSDLTVKGVWQIASGEIRAIVSTPKNEGVVVKEGDPISSGKVLSVHRDHVMVRLYRIRADGVREFDDLTMRIGGPGKNEKAVIKLEPGKDPTFLNPAQNSVSQPAAVRADVTGQAAAPVPTPAEASPANPIGSQPGPNIQKAIAQPPL